MTLARLYGRVLGQSSLAVVTEGFRSVLEAQGVLAGVCPVDVIEVPEEETHAGASARHGIYTGHLGRVGTMFTRGLHQHYWIMLAPNSNRLPADLVHVISGYAEKFPRRVHLMAPSAWAADVVSKQFDTHWTGPVLSVPHGVDTGRYKVNVARAEQMRKGSGYGEFRVLHFSTSAQSRKGTVELVKAWKLLESTEAWDSERAVLLCVMDRPAQEALMNRLFEEDVTLPQTVRIIPRADLTPEQMAQNLAWSHVVCQPSRGEAFGLIPLEALCCGVPVVATDCTGHSEYLTGMGVELVTTGPDEPLDDLPGSVAPSLDPAEIARALQYARSTWGSLQDEALKYADDWRSAWAWKVTLRPFVEVLRNT